jgi:hypothetical protein
MARDYIPEPSKSKRKNEWEGNGRDTSKSTHGATEYDFVRADL